MSSKWDGRRLESVLKFGLSQSFLRWLSAQAGRDDRVGRYARLVAESGIPLRTSFVLRDALHEYELDRSEELADRPVTERSKRVRRALSTGLMEVLSRELSFRAPGANVEERAARRRSLQLQAGWSPRAQGDKVGQLIQDSELKPGDGDRVEALARLLGYTGPVLLWDEKPLQEPSEDDPQV